MIDDWLGQLLDELPRAGLDSRVWAGILVALVVTALATALGTIVVRRGRLVSHDAPRSESLAVGLGLGLCLITAAWALVASQGQSSFTPVAVSYVVALAVLIRPMPASRADVGPVRALLDLRSIAIGALLVGAFAILYAATLAPGPRGGVQPIEFMDQAYYSVLGRDLSRSGLESGYSPAGFDLSTWFPGQMWYHWGELWLAAAVIAVFGSTPLDARHLVVLPVLLLATAALWGALARRLVGTTARRSVWFAVLACVGLAPIPVVGTAYHASWATGMAFGITVYGLAAVAISLGLYFVAALRGGALSLGGVGLVASTFALLVPAHILLSILLAAGAIVTIPGVVWLQRRRGRAIDWQGSAVRVAAWTGIVVVATVVWGLATGHALGGGGTIQGISPFNGAWLDSVTSVVIGSGIFLVLPLAAVTIWRHDPRIYGMAGFGIVCVAGGAVAWGLRIAEFNMFHAFFGVLAVVVTPLAAAATGAVVGAARRRGLRMVALVLVVAAIGQLEAATLFTTFRLQAFGPHDYAPIPTSVLTAIRSTPNGSKIAYGCRELEEVAIWDARLLSIDAHTDRRVIPMCFQAEVLGSTIGAPVDRAVASPWFQHAPQRALYPNADAVPSVEELSAFFRAHGIGYVLTDPIHPETFLPDVRVVAEDRGFRLLQLPGSG